MKKNNILYILIAVLFIVNVFLIVKHIGKPQHDGPKESGKFIATELKFDDAQIKTFNAFEQKHHQRMRANQEEIKALKDELFIKITAKEIDQENINRIIGLISDKEVVKEKEMFSRLRHIYELCNNEQKKHFNEILIKARKFDNKGPEMQDKR